MRAAHSSSAADSLGARWRAKTLLILVSALLLSSQVHTAAAAEDDYSKLLELSHLFYEAQMSGKLPAWNRLLASKPGGYKHNAHLTDGAVIGKDLSGGFYDAGDYLKCPLPLGWTLSNLVLSCLEFKSSYQSPGQWDTALKVIQWGTDWMMKAHVNASDVPAENVFVGQVSDKSDMLYFGRPEHATNRRPVYLVDSSTGGADVAAEYAAAFAAAAVLFRSNNQTTYAEKLFKHAQQAFGFAEAYQKNYKIPGNVFQAYTTFANDGYTAHLAWASSWMCKYTTAIMRTTKNNYCQTAAHWFDTAIRGGLYYNLGYDWDNVLPGAAAVLVGMNLQPVAQGAKAYLEGFILDKWQDTSSLCPKPSYSTVCYTPRGLAYYSDWGTLRNTANAMFIAALMAKHGIRKQQHVCWARMQMRYITGSLVGTNRSYVIGYGPNPPQQPFHRRSACSANYTGPCTEINGGTCCHGDEGVGAGGCCDAGNFASQHPALVQLKGALVAGPDQSDSFPDIRVDYQRSQVALDYNAGFTGAAAALAYFASTGLLAPCGAGPGILTPITSNSTIATSINSSSITAAATASHNKRGLPAGPLLVGYYVTGVEQSLDVKATAAAGTLDLASIPGHLNVIIVGFARPNCTYVRSSLDWTGSGLMFTSPGPVVKAAIASLQKQQPATRVLLGVGGPTYTDYKSVNTTCIQALVDDFGFDGIDLNHQAPSNCKRSSSGVTCPATDKQSIVTLTALRSALPSHSYMVSLSTRPMGLYGVPPYEKAKPVTNLTGVNVAMAKSKIGQTLDLINVMAYDAGNWSTTGFSWQEAYRAARAYWPDKAVTVAVSIGPDSWPPAPLSHQVTVDGAAFRANYVREYSRSAQYGITIWNLQKQGCPNVRQLAAAVCSAYNLGNCKKPLPFSQQTCALPSTAKHSSVAASPKPAAAPVAPPKGNYIANGTAAGAPLPSPSPQKAEVLAPLQLPAPAAQGAATPWNASLGVPPVLNPQAPQSGIPTANNSNDPGLKVLVGGNSTPADLLKGNQTADNPSSSKPAIQQVVVNNSTGLQQPPSQPSTPAASSNNLANNASATNQPLHAVVANITNDHKNNTMLDGTSVPQQPVTNNNTVDPHNIPAVGPVGQLALVAQRAAAPPAPQGMRSSSNASSLPLTASPPVAAAAANQSMIGGVLLQAQTVPNNLTRTAVPAVTAQAGQLSQTQKQSPIPVQSSPLPAANRSAVSKNGTVARAQNGSQLALHSSNGSTAFKSNNAGASSSLAAAVGGSPASGDRPTAGYPQQQQQAAAAAAGKAVSDVTSAAASSSVPVVSSSAAASLPPPQHQAVLGAAVSGATSAAASSSSPVVNSPTVANSTLLGPISRTSIALDSNAAAAATSRPTVVVNSSMGGTSNGVAALIRSNATAVNSSDLVPASKAPAQTGSMAAPVKGSSIPLSKHKDTAGSDSSAAVMNSTGTELVNGSSSPAASSSLTAHKSNLVPVAGAAAVHSASLALGGSGSPSAAAFIKSNDTAAENSTAAMSDTGTATSMPPAKGSSATPSSSSITTAASGSGIAAAGISTSAKAASSNPMQVANTLTAHASNPRVPVSSSPVATSSKGATAASSTAAPINSSGSASPSSSSSVTSIASSTATAAAPAANESHTPDPSNPVRAGNDLSGVLSHTVGPLQLVGQPSAITRLTKAPVQQPLHRDTAEEPDAAAAAAAAGTAGSTGRTRLAAPGLIPAAGTSNFRYSPTNASVGKAVAANPQSSSSKSLATAAAVTPSSSGVNSSAPVAATATAAVQDHVAAKPGTSDNSSLSAYQVDPTTHPGSADLADSPSPSEPIQAAKPNDTAPDSTPIAAEIQRVGLNLSAAGPSASFTMENHTSKVVSEVPVAADPTNPTGNEPAEVVQGALTNPVNTTTHSIPAIAATITSNPSIPADPSVAMSSIPTNQLMDSTSNKTTNDSSKQQPNEPLPSDPAILEPIDGDSPGASQPSVPAKPPVPAEPPGRCSVEVAVWSGCGGISGTCPAALIAAGKCTDAPWEGHCCPSGHYCKRENVWFWMCVPGTGGTTEYAETYEPYEPEPESAIVEADTCRSTVQGWQGCGGQGAACPAELARDKKCADAPWEGYCCAAGWKCSRDTQWWWMCQHDQSTITAQQHMRQQKPVALSTTHGAVPVSVPLWGSCGGSGSQCPNSLLSVSKCVDSVWDGHSCASGSACVRDSEWYYQCKPVLTATAAAVSAAAAPMLSTAGMVAEKFDTLMIKAPKVALASRQASVEVTLSRQGRPVPGAAVQVMMTTASKPKVTESGAKVIAHLLPTVTLEGNTSLGGTVTFQVPKAVVGRSGFETVITALSPDSRARGGRGDIIAQSPQATILWL